MEPSSKRKRSWRSWGGIAAFLTLAGGKLKFLLPLLKLGKFGGMIWSMALTIGAYGLIYPWSFAVGIVVMIFIHEMGHVLAAKRKGIPVTAPAFIPFLGALISIKKQPQDAATEAYLAFGGPLLGSIGAIGAFLLALLIHSPALLAVAQIGFFLNLINLVPIHPLDGGRIVTAISRWLWLLGLVGGLILILYFKAIIFLIFWVMFAWELYKKFVKKDRKEEILQETEVFVEIDKGRFEDYGIPIPAESHQRDLGYQQFCDCSTQDEYIHLYYPGVGLLAKVPIQLGLVKGARLMGTMVEESRLRMSIRLLIKVYPEYQSALSQPDEYYEVPRRTRLIFGLSYIGLAIFLIWMLYHTSSLFPIRPMIS